jgi:TrmH family RNA methyltransferase
MFTKNQSKLIKSLHDKKGRKESDLFLVEGEKSSVELLNSDFEIEYAIFTEYFYNKYSEIIEKGITNYNIVSQEEIEKNGTLESNDSALIVAKQKETSIPILKEEEIILALDEIKDPGNLGTIIRIADWYGIKNIVASENTTDFYNPKTISASKGSFTRINVFYTNLEEYLPKTKLPILGAFLGGSDVHTFEFPKSGMLLMGNESNGINKDLENIITEKITIPSYGEAESLNVAIATAVILDNWKK